MWQGQCQYPHTAAVYVWVHVAKKDQNLENKKKNCMCNRINNECIMSNVATKKIILVDNHYG